MIKPKKYRAKVLTMILRTDKGEEVPQYEIVEGYLAPVSVRQTYGMEKESKTQIIWGLYSDDVTLNDCCIMGCGMSVYKPHIYTGFTDLEEIIDKETDNAE